MVINFHFRHTIEVRLSTGQALNKGAGSTHPSRPPERLATRLRRSSCAVLLQGGSRSGEGDLLRAVLRRRRLGARRRLGLLCILLVLAERLEQLLLLRVLLLLPQRQLRRLLRVGIFHLTHLAEPLLAPLRLRRRRLLSQPQHRARVRRRHLPLASSLGPRRTRSLRLACKLPLAPRLLCCRRLLSLRRTAGMRQHTRQVGDRQLP